jgi:GT2 family glycosyltransferase
VPVAVPAHRSESVGAVILAYGRGRSFETVIDSLLDAGLAPTAIVLVHNPAGPDEAPPSAPAGIEVVATGRNRGYAGGMNVGVECLRRRGSRLLLLLTHDAALRPGALASMTASMDRDPTLGIVGPVLLLSGGEAPFSYGGTTGPSGLNSHRRTVPDIDAAGVARCDWVDGGTMLVRGEVLDGVGGFDELFWSYVEEADLCLRVRRGGWGVGVVLAAQADQEPGAVKRPGVWSYLMTRNGIEYARRNSGIAGLAGSLLRADHAILVAILRAAARRLGLRPGPWREPWSLAVGAARGQIDFARRRWGPPPADLPGSGDVANL